MSTKPPISSDRPFLHCDCWPRKHLQTRPQFVLSGDDDLSKHKSPRNLNQQRKLKLVVRFRILKDPNMGFKYLLLIWTQLGITVLETHAVVSFHYWWIFDEFNQAHLGQNMMQRKQAVSSNICDRWYTSTKVLVGWATWWWSLESLSIMHSWHLMICVTKLPVIESAYHCLNIIENCFRSKHRFSTTQLKQSSI